MALRCNDAVRDLFRVTGELIQQNRKGVTGDQRVVNRALAEPWHYGTPRVKWAIFPNHDRVRAAEELSELRRGVTRVTTLHTSLPPSSAPRYEIATDTVADVHTRDGMYGTNFNNWVLFHANDYGRAGMASSKARVAKMNLLEDAENMARHSPTAKRPRLRWPYVPTPTAPARRPFPRGTEGG